MIVYIVGIFLVGLMPTLIPTTTLLLLLPVSCLIWNYYPKLLPLLLGIAVAVWFGNTQLGSRITELEAGKHHVVGKVSSSVVNKAGVVRFNLEVLQSHSTPSLVSRKLMLSWYQPDKSITQNDIIATKVSIKPPHGFANPSGFDFERWALVNGIDGVGYLRNVDSVIEQKAAPLVRIRKAITRMLQQRYGEASQVSATVIALLIGDKQYFNEATWQVMRATGTVHLVVVSGLHIGICVAVGWWLGRAAQSLLIVLGVRRFYKLPAVTALVVSGLYVALAGFSIPTIRAWAMAAVFLGGWLLSWGSTLWRRFWASMAVVLSLQPLAFWEAGFWLSFSAVAILIYLSEQRYGSRSRWLAMAWRSQVAIFLVITPFLLHLFGALTLLSPIVNLAAIPFIMLLLPVLFLSTFLALIADFPPPLDFVASGLEWFWQALHWAAIQGEKLQFEGIHLSKFDVALALLGSALLLLPLASQTRFIGVIFWFLALQPSEPAPVERFTAKVFDVGQGTSVLITTSDHALLYDTGRSYKSGRSAFLRAVLPALQAGGTQSLDKLVISHADNDHAGGTQHALDSIPVAKVESGMPDDIGVAAVSCHHVRPWQWNGVRFRYLVPSVSLDNSNDRSCILEVRSDTCSLLLTGDAGQAVERSLINELYPTDWLLLGHHGSKTSTSNALLDQLKPVAAIVSAGYMNPYHHPHPSVMQRVTQREIQVWRTDHHGMITLRDNGVDGCLASSWRKSWPRYWSISF